MNYSQETNPVRVPDHCEVTEGVSFFFLDNALAGFYKMNEEWREIVGYEGYYQVSNYGRVKSVARTIQCSDRNLPLQERILRQGYINAGYRMVSLTMDGVGKSFTVHRLVADAFIPNRDEKPCINHKDGDKENNRVDNLEWVTYSENNQHALDTDLRKPPGLDAYQYTLDGELVAYYESSLDAERKTGINHSHICSTCLGKRKSAGGYKWSRTKI